MGPLFKFCLLIFKIGVTLSQFSSLLEGGVVEGDLSQVTASPIRFEFKFCATTYLVLLT